MSNNSPQTLHEAIRRGDLHILKIMIKAGVNVNKKEKNGNGNTPLHTATRIGSIEMMQLLLKAGADVHIENGNGWTALQCATDQPDVEKAKVLIDAGADSSEKVGKFGRAALHLAVEQNNVEVVKHLLSCVEDVNIKCEFLGQTPLHKAAASNAGDSHIHIMEALLKNKKVKIDAKDGEKRTALYRLLSPWKSRSSVGTNIVELFLKFKPDLNALDRDGETPLATAVKKSRNFEVVQALIDHGANVNWVNPENGFTLMHYACRENVDVKILECLLNNGVDINVLDSEGRPPVFHLFHYGYIQTSQKCRTLDFLLKHGADVNIVWTHKDKFPTYLYTNKENEKKSNAESPVYKCVLDIEYIEHEKELWKIIVEHIAKLQSLNRPIHSKVLDSIEKSNVYKDYYNLCKKELKLAKYTKIDDSAVTCYSVLVEDKKKLETVHAKNKNFVEDFKRNQCKRKFPIYGVLMEENIDNLTKKKRCSK